MKVYEEQSSDKVSENIKLAVLLKYLCDGELARHLNLHSGRLTTYDLARKEAIKYLRAKRTWTASGSSDPVDLSPLSKGKGGKKGKGKGKGDKSAKPKECFYCGKPRHNKNECRNFSAALRKKSVQPEKAGRYAAVEADPERGNRKPSGEKGTGAVIFEWPCRLSGQHLGMHPAHDSAASGTSTLPSASQRGTVQSS